ncbi:MAG TPA: peptidyl-prolyl cis-trans isomerase [Thermoanaerobaculia bacterium]|jgi:parvulin-like peptidyl-prolyl isomerase|nr:peptidyl-prolyl cis-trans isomerase [Thermoanaerobaculia bacterium]
MTPKKPLAADSHRPQRAASGALLLILPVLAGMGLAAAPPAAAEVVNKIVLRINDRIVTQHDYEVAREDLRREISRRNLDPQEKEQALASAGEVAFKNLYEDLLLQSRADQLSITATEQEVEASVQQMRENFNITSDEQFRGALAQSGMTENELRENLRKNLRVRELVGREVQAKIKLEEDDLRRYYQKNVDLFRVPEQVHLREAVILAEKTPAAAERGKIASQVRAAVVGGQTLADAAKPFEDQAVASGVVDLGWLSQSDLDPNIVQAAWSLAPGASSEPTEGRGGTHLLQMVERRPSYVRPFPEVQAEIEGRERNRLFKDRFAQYEQELEKDSLIVARPPAEATEFRRLIGAPPEDPLEAADRIPADAPAAGTTAAAPASPAPEATPPAPQAPENPPGR